MDGTYSYSPTASINVDKSNESYSLVPNPVTDIVSVIGLDRDVKYSLFDCIGTRLKTGTLMGKHQLSVEDLPNGIYILQLNINGKLVSQRLIKN